MNGDKAILHTRTLAWEGCYNVRDLGGLPTKNGRKTAWGRIVRADILERLTAKGQQALADYGIQTIIDLRGAHEVEQFPYQLTALPQAAQPYYLNLPLESYEPHVGALIMQAKTRAEVYCIILDHYPHMMAKVMRTIASAAEGGIVLHCYGGKDRTGTVVALLLRLAGVADGLIGVDYAASQILLQSLYEQEIAKAGGEEFLDFWARPTATADMIHETLTHIDKKYGGVAPYLRHAGLTDGEIEALRESLVGD